jgi:putative PEP-CTERM system histidine kinase
MPEILPATSVGALGYAAAALLLAALAILLLTTWRGRLQGGLLLAAVLANALWAGFLGAQAQWHSLPVELVWAVEAGRMLAWLLFLIRMLQLLQAGETGQLRALRWSIVFASLLLMLPFEDMLLAFLPDYGGAIGNARLIGLVMLMVAGLFLIEQIYRNTPWQHRWGIKFLCFGLGALFAYDFYFFADALLFGRIDRGLFLSRGAVNAFVVPFIAVSVARNPQWSFDLSVSRTVVMHSTTLVAAGVYLLFMALAGYYIRYYGGEWSTVFQPLFFFGAGLLLMVLLFSGQLRSHLKLFVSKHFFSYRYDYREEWLRLISVLSGQVLQATLPERIIYALAELVESTGGAIWVRAADGGCEFRRCWNIPDTSIDPRWRTTDFCVGLRRSGQVIEIEQAEDAGPSANALALPDWMRANPDLWLIVPLLHEDQLMGFVVLAKARVPLTLDWENIQLLQTAARQAASYLALDEAAAALAQARQFEGFNRLAAFIVHDLKNLVAQLSLITRNAERYRSNPEFVEDAFETVRHSVDKMNRLLAQLRSAVPSGRDGEIALRPLLERVVSERAAQPPIPSLQVVSGARSAVRADSDRLYAVLNNVVQNAQEASGKDGRVEVRLSERDAGAMIEIVDNGCGMDDEFVRERLFRPFDSTKGLAGMGIGAYECKEFVTLLGGRVEVDSTPGVGTCFQILIPLATNITDQSLATAAV